MATLNLEFLDVFVIGDNTDRNGTLINQLERCFSCHLRIIKTNYVRKFPENFNQKAFFHMYKRTASLGEVGCLLAHLEVYEKMMDSACEWAAIFEDSARVDENQLCNVLNQLTMFLKNGVSEPVLINLHSPNAEVVVRHATEKTIVETLSLLRMTKGYLINKSAMQFALLYRNKLNDVADWGEWIKCVRSFAVVNPVVTRASNLSSLVGHETDQNQFRKRSTLTKLFRIFSLTDFLVYRSKTGRRDYLYRILMHQLLNYLLNIGLLRHGSNRNLLFFKNLTLENYFFSINSALRYFYRTQSYTRFLARRLKFGVVSKNGSL